MFVKMAGYVGMGVSVFLLAQTMVTTYYLAKIDKGLKTSLSATSSLIDIQKAIIHKNESLQDVVATTKAMDAGLDQTLRTTLSIHEHIAGINALNGATLQLNLQMATAAKESGNTLENVSGSMMDLKEDSGALAQSLAQLKQWVQQDSGYLDRMRGYTEDMNRKVPGVLP